MEQKHFPNGFTNWKETFYEAAHFMQDELNNYLALAENLGYDTPVTLAQEQGGHFAVVQLAEQWTDEYEELNKDREWDGEWYDEVYAFFTQKNTPTPKPNKIHI